MFFFFIKAGLSEYHTVFCTVLSIFYSLFQAILTDFVLELGLDGVDKGLRHHQSVSWLDWSPLLHHLTLCCHELIQIFLY